MHINILKLEMYLTVGQDVHPRSEETLKTFSTGLNLFMVY